MFQNKVFESLSLQYNQTFRPEYDYQMGSWSLNQLLDSESIFDSEQQIRVAMNSDLGNHVQGFHSQEQEGLSILLAEKNSTIYNGNEYVEEAMAIVLFDGKYADHMWIIDFQDDLLNFQTEDTMVSTEKDEKRGARGTVYQFENWMGINKTDCLFDVETTKTTDGTINEVNEVGYEVKPSAKYSLKI